jgi:anthranilate synthase component 1
MSTTKNTTKPINSLKIKKISLTQQPLEIFSKLQKQYKTAYLLESIEGPQKLAQYSFLGFDPKIIITAKDGTVTITSLKTSQTTTQKTNDPFKLIQEQLKPYANNMVDFRFVGGALGYVSYDAIRYIEKLPNQKPDDLKFPDVEMGIFEDGFVFDHTINQAYYYFRGENRLAEVVELLKQPAAPEEQFTYTQPTVNTSKEQSRKPNSTSPQETYSKLSCQNASNSSTQEAF